MPDTQYPKSNTQYPARVRVVEVGPRDGLQNEAEIVPTEAKIRFIEMLADAGFSDVEVSSFVNPKRVPQLADAAEVFAGLKPRPGVRYSALVPNMKGLERAMEAGVKSIALFTAASETFTQRNIGMTIAESLSVFKEIAGQAKQGGLWVRAYVSTAFHCPFEGRISPLQVLPVADALTEMGVDEISLGDTIGKAVPTEVSMLLDGVLGHQPSTINHQLALHFHDTRGTALANVLTGLQYGITTFDSSAGGLGGCPFAPGAAGNLATEDLLYMLHGMGFETGVDLDKVVAASQFLAGKLGRPLPGKYLQSVQASCQ